MSRVVRIGQLELGTGKPLAVIAGPCVLESERHALKMAGRLAAATREMGVPYIFKASFDKANRTALDSYRGPGLARGLEILARIKRELGVPILTDVHEAGQVGPAAEVCDILQIPAFLSRQTDLLLEVGRSGAVVNIKKGQFLSPWDIRHAVEKVRSTGNARILVTERGASFGYNNLVVDMRGLAVMKEFGVPKSSMSPTRCNFPVEKATTAAGNRSTLKRWRGRAWRRAWMAFLWKFTTIRLGRFPTERIPLTCGVSSRSWRACAIWGTSCESSEPVAGSRREAKGSMSNRRATHCTSLPGVTSSSLVVSSSS